MNVTRTILDTGVSFRETGPNSCSVDGCEREVDAKGFCRPHYRRWLRFGDPGTNVARYGKEWVKPVCIVKDCDHEARAHGLCGTHYARWRKHGDPSIGGKALAVGYLDDNGYRMISVDGQFQVGEHRLAMEEWLGRSLSPRETVHHRNGVRDDNRLFNLELWSSRHPKGQRVDELVAWAVEILRIYGREFVQPGEGRSSRQVHQDPKTP